MNNTKWDRKEYDKQRAKNLYSLFIARREKAVESFGKSCFLCKENGKRKDFQFHHLWYHPIESNYDVHAKSMWIREKRLKEVEEHPERFVLLCGECHGTIEGIKRQAKALDKKSFLKLLQFALEI
jgi:hypothetical protein